MINFKPNKQFYKRLLLLPVLPIDFFIIFAKLRKMVQAPIRQNAGFFIYNNPGDREILPPGYES